MFSILERFFSDNFKSFINFRCYSFQHFCFLYITYNSWLNYTIIIKKVYYIIYCYRISLFSKEHVPSKHYHYPKNAWIRSRIFLYMVFVFLYREYCLWNNLSQYGKIQDRIQVFFCAVYNFYSSQHTPSIQHCFNVMCRLGNTNIKIEKVLKCLEWTEKVRFIYIYVWQNLKN